MKEKPSEELVERMWPALSDLAHTIEGGVILDKDMLKQIVSKLGFEKQLAKQAFDELECWCNMLQAASNISGDMDQKKEEIIILLKERGIPEAPAILAVERALGKPLICEPDAVNFGLLKLGQATNTTLTVTGKLSVVTTTNSRLRVTKHERSSIETLIKVLLSSGQAGELFHGEVILQGQRGELRVPVTAHWETEPSRLQLCPICQVVGIHGEGSLFWISQKSKFECFNHECKVEGPSLDKLRKPRTYYT